MRKLNKKLSVSDLAFNFSFIVMVEILDEIPPFDFYACCGFTVWADRYVLLLLITVFFVAFQNVFLH